MTELLGLLRLGPEGWGDELLAGLQVTLSLALATAPIGLVGGFLLALARRAESPVVRVPATTFTTIFKGLPELITLFIVYYGFSMVLLSAAVKGVPEDTLEAARIDGANERAIFFRVVVPQIWGTVITVYVTTLIGVMKIFDIVYVMTNGGFNTNVIGNEFFNQLFSNFNNGAAAAIVVLLMLATIPIMVYQVRNFRREESMA